MDNIETHRDNSKISSTQDPESDQARLRQRSSRRLRHEAEVQVFKSKAGNLEEIRQTLGLRPSQICEILKVHPSAWTRWVRDQEAPPHIYQMLEWYIELLSWRGQNNPLTGTPFIPKKIASQELESKLPEREPFAPHPIPHHKFKKFVDKKTFIAMLLASLIFQFCLWGVTLMWLKSH